MTLIGLGLMVTSFTAVLSLLGIFIIESME